MRNENDMSADSYVDSMSIAILMDKEKDEYVDYFFVSDVWEKDPRFTNRNMLIGQNRGLFRINKKTLDAELLHPMVGDESGKRFTNAASKVLQEYKNTNAFPDKTQFASG
jgi:hypothetical protein